MHPVKPFEALVGSIENVTESLNRLGSRTIASNDTNNPGFPTMYPDYAETSRLVEMPSPPTRPPYKLTDKEMAEFKQDFDFVSRLIGSSREASAALLRLTVIDEKTKWFRNQLTLRMELERCFTVHPLVPFCEESAIVSWVLAIKDFERNHPSINSDSM